MAGEWIKMRGNLWDDPRVGSMADECEVGEAAIIGGLYWLWATADQHTEDGVMPGMSRRLIDRKTGIPGFGDALAGVGWIADHPDGLLIVKFEEHNGASAKRRCMEAQRKANARSASASDADTSRTDGGHDTPETGRDAELEKRREEKSNTSSSLRSEEPRSKRAAPPDAPAEVDPQVWADWLQLRKSKKAPVTDTVLKAAKAEAAEAGMSLEAFLRIWCARGSQGLQADWLKPHERAGPPAGRLDRQLETAALLTGARRPQPKPLEAIDVESRILPP